MEHSEKDHSQSEIHEYANETILTYNLNLTKTFLVEIRFQPCLKTINGGYFFGVKRKFVPFCRGGKSEWT